MQVETSNLRFADATVIEYINEIITNYENEIQKLKRSAIEYENKYLEMKERYDLLIYKRFCRSAEQVPFDSKQLMLFTHEAEPVQIPSEEEKAEKIEVKSYVRSNRGRKPIDAKIRRVERTVDIPEEEKICACGAQLSRIGEESSEKLVIIEPQIYVDKIIRPKYACRCCEGVGDEDKPAVRIAPAEPSMIPRGIASPSLLSWIFTHKFEDPLPYYRQERQFERIGVAMHGEK
jgi:transposase